MRLTNVFTGRPSYYDRNPTQQVRSGFSLGNGPHASTNRWTYTVPSARKSLLAYATGFMDRVTVATTVGQHGFQVEITPSGGSLTEVVKEVIEGSNVGDTTRKSIVGGGLVLLAGDNIVAGDFDLSTGGTVDWVETAGMTEFDA